MQAETKDLTHGVVSLLEYIKNLYCLCNIFQRKNLWVFNGLHHGTAFAPIDKRI